MFELVLLRAVRIEGRLLVAGARLQADAVAAREWIAAGRARLAHDRDLPALIRAAGLRQPEPATRC